jgi:pimeloyl-ACP methyl ester carboxylesterase
MLELAAELGTFRGISEEWRTPLVSELAKLGIPTLVMWGDHDRVLPFRHFTAAAAAFPVAETHVFAGAGHMPQIERADEFAAVVEGFLRRQHQGARAAHSQGAGS